jgi:hypothetical protein
MHGQIIPKIYSANKRLMFSETLCFNPCDGVIIKVPTSDGKSQSELTFSLQFTDDENKTESSYKTENLGNNTLKFVFENFGGTLGSGTTTPVKFSIGDTSYFLYFYAQRLHGGSDQENKMLHMTITMYGEAK